MAELVFSDPSAKISVAAGKYSDSFTMDCQASILMRDLLSVFLPGRVIPLPTTEYLVFSSEYKGANDEALSNYVQGVNDGKRYFTPLALSTHFELHITKRELMDFLYMLKVHNPSLYQAYRLVLWQGDSSELDKHHSFSNIFDQLSVQDGEFQHVGQSNLAGDVFVGIYRVTNGLIHQISLNPYIQMKSELFNRINQKSLADMITYTHGDSSVVAIYARKAAYHRVISRGCCFIADWDDHEASSWSKIAERFLSRIKPEAFANLLPCKCNGEDCPIKGLHKKLMENEEFIPCPVLLEYPDLVDYRGQKRSSSSVVFQWWTRILHLIKNNPDNLLRKDYIRNVLSKENVMPIMEAVKLAQKERREKNMEEMENRIHELQEKKAASVVNEDAKPNLSAKPVSVDTTAKEAEEKTMQPVKMEEEQAWGTF